MQTRAESCLPASRQFDLEVLEVFQGAKTRNSPLPTGPDTFAVRHRLSRFSPASGNHQPSLGDLVAPPFMVELFAADGLPTGLRAVLARLVCLAAPKLPTLARVARTPLGVANPADGFGSSTLLVQGASCAQQRRLSQHPNGREASGGAPWTLRESMPCLPHHFDAHVSRHCSRGACLGRPALPREEVRTFMG